MGAWGGGPGGHKASVCTLLCVGEAMPRAECEHAITYCATLHPTLCTLYHALCHFCRAGIEDLQSLALATGLRTLKLECMRCVTGRSWAGHGQVLFPWCGRMGFTAVQVDVLGGLCMSVLDTHRACHVAMSVTPVTQSAECHVVSCCVILCQIRFWGSCCPRARRLKSCPFAAAPG